ncbi:MAG: 5'-deoxynucleotidase [Clostridia bacterium]|nr:5'-deoxynucleotidase [Clostridia bacterium]
MENGFFAMHSRMKYIDRWALMRNTFKENISAHSNDVAAVAHALAVIGNVRLGKKLDADRAAVLGLYHDMPEIITGDMPTPVKYHSAEIRKEFAAVENEACRTLLSMLPDDIAAEYEGFFFEKEEDMPLHKIVKAADKLSALIKCIEEKKAGNSEFDSAFEATRTAIKALDCPEADIFLDEFIPPFYKSLDELTK